ncbi:MAG: porin [Alphaproteobacteria bacterium]|nr:porin [Alphaproteobacteria bacterium]
MKTSLLLSACTLGILASTAPALAASDQLPSREEMWQMIQMQQKQIEALQSQIQTHDQKIARTETKVEETAKVAETAQKTVANIEPAAGGNGAGNGWWNKTSIGGYGELHYSGGSKDTLDLHRFVVNLNHEFNEDIRLHSEIEIEHALAGDGEAGEVEVEQAYVEFDLTEDDAHRAKAGVFLVPVGILNEKHEPPTFFGVERNPVESNIVPSTWWEGGAALSGNLGQSGLSYDIAAHSGLKTPTTGSNAYKIRNGRQKTSEAEATDPAFTGRLKWTGYPGVELGATAQYQKDVSQNSGDDSNVDATLLEAHADLRKGGWGMRALYARWDLDGSAPKSTGRDEQYGWYVEPSYRFDVPFGYDGEGELGVFARYNEWDNNAGASNSPTEFEQTDVGLNYWPIKNVVLKADMAFIDGPTDSEDDEVLNLGVGWQF